MLPRRTWLLNIRIQHLTLNEMSRYYFMGVQHMRTHIQQNIAVSIFFGLAVILHSVSSPAQDKKPAWKGKVETENGVKIVKNPAEPLFGEFAFDLREDLVFGGDPAKEESYFPSGAVLSVDGEGNFYVADFGNRRVQMFDKAGKFVRQIGRQGQGPGEYGHPSRVFFAGEGNPCVWGGSELIHYDKNGVYKKKVLLKTFLNSFILGPRDTIIGTTQPRIGPGGPKYSIVQLNSDGTPLRTLAEYRGEFNENQKAVAFHAYSNGIAFSPLTAELFAYGFSGEYRIYIADADGQIAHVIAKDEKPLPISGKEKDQTKKHGIYASFGASEKREDAVVFPDHRPFFGRFFNDDAGRLYVMKSSSIFDKDSPKRIDVFSNDGIFLYKMTWSFVPAAIKAGCLYEVHEDKETSEFSIVRHRIENWGAMKAGL